MDENRDIIKKTVQRYFKELPSLFAPKRGLITPIYTNEKSRYKLYQLNTIQFFLTLFFRRGSGIRTHDPLLPKQNDRESYLVTYQLIVMMRANHFKDSSKNAILRALFCPFLTHNSKEQFLAFEHCFLAVLSEVAL